MSRTKVRIDTGNETFDTVVWLSIFTFLVSLPAAWITHIVWVIRVLASDKGATLGQAALGAIGAFMPPVGVVHGYMIWFGIGL